MTFGGQHGRLQPGASTSLRSVPALSRLSAINLQDWWPLLEQESRNLLILNNGDVLSAAVVADIARVNGSVALDGWWVVAEGPTSFHLSDAAVDWIGAMANGEVPHPPPEG